jgi:hypothetical protein
MNQGEALKVQGHYRRAQEITQEGYDIFVELGDMQGLALASNNLGEIAEANGDEAGAIATFIMSLDFYRRMEDRPGMAMTLLNLGRIFARQGDAHAIPYLQEGTAIYEELGNYSGMIECMLSLAAFKLQTNAPQAALHELQMIAELLQKEQTPAVPDTLRQCHAKLLEQAHASDTGANMR